MPNQTLSPAKGPVSKEGKKITLKNLNPNVNGVNNNIGSSSEGT
jgi:hypothetical protein